MSHPAIDNRTPFTLAPLFQADELGRPIVSVLVKGTFTWDAQGNVRRATQQLPWCPTGTHRGAPGASSVLYEPEVAPIKLATDVAVIAHAHAPDTEAKRMEVVVEVGSVNRHLVVTGDRFFRKGWLGVGITDPLPFERIPLSWENAFGGWDRTFEEVKEQGYESRNPFGAGFRLKSSPCVEDVRLPNIEDPAAPVRGWGKPVVPAGVGFTCPDMLPRRAFAGTYDEVWQKERSPFLPKDFDRRFFTAAAPGMSAEGYLRGDERVLLRGVTPSGVLDLALPSIAPPVITVAFRHAREDLQQATVLDTVIINVDATQLILQWRTLVTLDQGPHEISDIAAAETTLSPALST